MKNKKVLWITAVAAILLLTGISFSYNSFFCQTAEKAGIVKASDNSGCTYKSEQSGNAAVVMDLQKAKSGECNVSSADCPHPNKKAQSVTAEKKDCSSCPYQKTTSTATVAENTTPDEDAGTME
ncbi:MAG: hypothetical protein D6748_02765 [Calditrichaeota bacterium]|nr:MAG: hypothetical protein D6748_02765 [Calditrichota bacterium]